MTEELSLAYLLRESGKIRSEIYGGTILCNIGKIRLRYMEERFSAIPERSDLGYMVKLFSVISHSLDRIYGGNKNGFKFA